MTAALRTLALVAVLLLPALPCPAQEVAPRIDHAPLARATRGEPIRLRAIVTSPLGKPIVEAAALVRPAGLTRFSRVPLAPDPAVKDLFVATLPDSLAGADFAYYLEAFDADGNGPARAGSPEGPYHVAVVAPAPVPVAAPPTPAQHVQTILLAPPAPEPRSHAATATLGILGGLFTGAGAALLLQREADQEQVRADQLNGWSVDASHASDQQLLTILPAVLMSVGGAMLVGAIFSGAWPADEPATPAPAPPASQRAPDAAAAAPTKEVPAP